MIYEYIGQILYEEYNKRNNTTFTVDEFFDNIVYPAWWKGGYNPINANNFALCMPVPGVRESIAKSYLEKDYKVGRNSRNTMGYNGLFSGSKIINTNVSMGMSNDRTEVNSKLQNIGICLGFCLSANKPYTAFMIDRDLIYFIFERVTDYMKLVHRGEIFDKMAPYYVSQTLIHAMMRYGYKNFNNIPFDLQTKNTTRNGISGKNPEISDQFLVLLAVHMLTNRDILNINMINLVPNSGNHTVGYVSFDFRNISQHISNYYEKLIGAKIVKNGDDVIDTRYGAVCYAPLLGKKFPMFEKYMHLDKAKHTIIVSKFLGYDSLSVDDLILSNNVNQNTLNIVLSKLNDLSYKKDLKPFVEYLFQRDDYYTIYEMLKECNYVKKFCDYLTEIKLDLNNLERSDRIIIASINTIIEKLYKLKHREFILFKRILFINLTKLEVNYEK